MATYKAFMQVEVNGVLTANVMHFTEGTPGSNPDREAELNEYLTAGTPGAFFGAVWKNAVSDEAKITCTKIQKVFPLPVGTQRVFFQELQGTIVDDASPAQLCAVIRNYSALGSRRGRGRHFFAGIPDSSLDGGNYTAAGLALWEQVVAAFYPGAASPDGTDWLADVYSAMDDVYRPSVNAQIDPIPRNRIERTSKLCGS